MAKFGALFFIALIVCSTTLNFAARPMPDSPHGDSEKENLKVNDIENCQGASDEDCLLRRTLVAHTDYIYTQSQNP
ncbi:phytosulfokines 3-like [Chenopodium quinoa]|uniref:Phytosulfokine n=1 Tax=Chenopodium quinoa TaxID=63459 RepID=A0A803L6P8_CHEQI|nr:phytosulfokines 3-like [Chenopodium quinoa]